VNIGSADGVAIGQELRIYREETSIHPATGRIIKGGSKDICIIAVTGVDSNASRGSIKSCVEGERPEKGDKVSKGGKGGEAPAVQSALPAPIPEAPVGKGDLYIKTEPPGAIIIIDGKELTNKTPVSIPFLKAGTHNVSIRKDNMGLDTQVNVVPDDITKVSLKLEAMKGRLKVISNPPESKVFLDGELKGETPLIIKNVVSGPHNLRLEKEGYVDKKEIIKIDIEKVNEYSYILKPVSILSIKSNIDGASVKINDKDIGVTPIEIKLEPGKYKVAVSKNYYKGSTSYVNLSIKERKEMNIVLEGEKGIVIITSVTPGANIFIDGNRVGVTPFRSDLISAGEHIVLVQLNGFKDWQKKVEIVKDKSLQLEVKLEPLTGRLWVKTSPPGAYVLIDGQKVGTTPIENLEVNTGKRIVVIKKERYNEISETINISPDRDYKIYKKMNRGEYENITSW